MHKRHCLLTLASLAAFGLAPGLARAQARPAAGAYREMKWEELVPKGWDPSKEMAAMRLGGSKLGLLSDDDPKVQELMKKMREAWDNAPTIKELDGASIRLPGYVVPLEVSKDEMKEFLLVPYFGACIHTPPPPANQIVHVVANKPVKGIRSMDPVWVSGVIRSGRQDSAMGTSGYRMAAALIVPYETPPGR
jgi:uncharacterized protein